ncbi:MAG: phytanoyl-CoA dioxygenase family protein [bacterium]|nr:phytanoyl-CoA dioxygenase family protein [bacterium]
MDTVTRTDLRKAYDEKGYVIVRSAIDPGLAAEMVDHIHWLGHKHPGVRPEHFHHNLLVNEPFIHHLVGDERLLDLAEQFIGPDIALFAAHYIAKEPTQGQAVMWHQDGSYWPLEPMEVTTLWVAGTDSTVENGCMRVIPGTQNKRLLKRRELMELDREKYVLGVGIRPDQMDDSDAVDLELKAGDVSVHNPNIIHGSNANTSEAWRVGLTLRYIPTSTWVKKENHENILFRGTVVPGVDNAYAERPRFISGEHMPFKGCETWNVV